MALDAARIQALSRRLLLARFHLLCSHGFYGVLLMHMTMTLDEECETASTDGKRMYFCPDFLDTVSDAELEFVMMHEVLHCALLHCTRRHDRDPYLFNIACDIVVNSNILASCNMDPTRITLEEYGEMMHRTPDGQEGYLFTAEQVYEMLLDEVKKHPTSSLSGGSSQQTQGGNQSGAGQTKQSSGGAPTQGDNAGGGHTGSNKTGSKTRGKGAGAQGNKPSDRQGQGGETDDGASGARPDEGRLDDHSRWGTVADDSQEDEWICRVKSAVESISIRDPEKTRGLVPLCAERVLEELAEARVDWRTVLSTFVQQEVCDYSFSPPDRRFDDTPFYLPDFNDTTESVKNVLFMIDTSGSMTDEMISKAYDEIYGAIEQFNGRLEGYLGFFDAVAVPAKPFSSIKELEIIRPFGGGGTSFHCVLHYAIHEMDEPPVSIIILTDGYAPFPKESDANGIPVMWVINNEDVTPPWGKIARISVDD